MNHEWHGEERTGIDPVNPGVISPFKFGGVETVIEGFGPGHCVGDPTGV